MHLYLRNSTYQFIYFLPYISLLRFCVSFWFPLYFYLNNISIYLPNILAFKMLCLLLVHLGLASAGSLAARGSSGDHRLQPYEPGKKDFSIFQPATNMFAQYCEGSQCLLVLFLGCVIILLIRFPNEHWQGMSDQTTSSPLSQITATTSTRSGTRSLGVRKTRWAVKI